MVTIESWLRGSSKIYVNQDTRNERSSLLPSDIVAQRPIDPKIPPMNGDVSNKVPGAVEQTGSRYLRRPWCLKAKIEIHKIQNDTVDGSEILRSPVDMAVYPILQKRILRPRWCRSSSINSIKCLGHAKTLYLTVDSVKVCNNVRRCRLPFMKFKHAPIKCHVLM